MAYENEAVEEFTFVTCSDTAHAVEKRYMKRRDADLFFDRITQHMIKGDVFVAYYCASVGGLVNAHYAT